MRGLRLTLVALAAATALVGAISIASANALSTRPAASCHVLAAPSSLAKTLLGLHRTYERHQPDVHNPTITGPVGLVDLGACGGEHHSLAWFDARYNGLYFGTEDQPERFSEPPGGGWRDIGNTGGDPCGAAPITLLKAWKIVRSCPG